MFLLLAVISCENTVFDPIEKEGRIFVEAFLDESGKNLIKVSVAQPIGGSISTSPQQIKIKILADGNEVKLNPDKTHSTSTVCAYRTDTGFEVGQKLKLTAEATRLPSVEAETYIPEKLPKVWTDDNLNTLIYNFNIQLFIEEPYAQGKWFGVQILKRKRYEFTGLVPENIRKQYEKQSGIEEFDEICEKETITDNNGLVSVRSNMIVGLNGGDMMITEGMKRDEKTTCLQIPVKITGKTLVASSSHENYKIYEYHEYKTRLYRLTKESYSYLKSRYIAENSSTLIDLGFSPVNYSYTNITGGLGIFAGTATYDSEWTAYNDYWHDYVPKE